MALLGLNLAATTDADLRTLFAFALLHDAFRLNDGDNEEHGARAATWAGSTSAKLEGVDVEKLCFAITSLGQTSNDPTIGACWDADRLDLVRLGCVPREDAMSTEPGIAAARRLSVAATPRSRQKVAAMSP